MRSIGTLELGQVAGGNCGDGDNGGCDSTGADTSGQTSGPGCPDGMVGATCVNGDVVVDGITVTGYNQDDSFGKDLQMVAYGFGVASAVTRPWVPVSVALGVAGIGFAALGTVYNMYTDYDRGG